MARERGADKPLDVGNGLVCASFSLEGGWLSLGTVHPRVGFVELSGLPPFDEAWRGDAAATRRYRGWMTEDRFAFLAIDDSGLGPMRADATDPVRPAWLASGLEVDARALPGTRTIVQRWRGNGGARRVRFAGRLDKPALAEITEVNPPAEVAGTTRVEVDGRRLRVLAPQLPAAASIEASTGVWVLDAAGAWLKGASGDLTLRCALAPTGDPPPLADPDAPLPAIAEVPDVAELPADLRRIVHRALAYVRGCTALELARGERAVLTDHRLLPLSWTRDAYYQALLLLATGEDDDVERVADHLRWLWRRCERPDGRWLRSHHANGRRKDHAFQADQQLYPLVELADFWRSTRTLPDRVDWADAIPQAWRATLAAVDPATGLIASAETAADDPAVAPFIASAQVLWWAAAVRAAEVAEQVPIGLDPAALHAVAEQIRASFDRHIVANGRWAYAVDGGGVRIDYHDANDLPTAMAPMLGFCGADDPAWRATMAFAFSPANPAFVSGDRGGLGSGHTPGPWPLGEVQAWIYARSVRDDQAAARAVARLVESAFPDGMLAEALAPGGPVRHWFAWPGAGLAALALLDARGELAGRLAARRTASERGR
jgi:hypothetical protein